MYVWHDILFFHLLSASLASSRFDVERDWLMVQKSGDHHLTCMKTLQILRYLPYQPVSRISEPSTVGRIICLFWERKRADLENWKSTEMWKVYHRIATPWYDLYLMGSLSDEPNWEKTMRNRLYFVRLPPSKRTPPFGSRTVFSKNRRFQRVNPSSSRGCSIGQTFGKGSSWIPSLPLSGIYMSPGDEKGQRHEKSRIVSLDPPQV